jgi:hypothetical protein
MLACQPVVLHSAASLGGDTAGQLRKLLWRRNAKKGRNNAQVLHVMKAVPCTAKTMFCYGCGQRFTCWERLCKHLAVGGHPHERGGNNAEKNNKGVVAPPRKRKTPQPAAPPVKDVAQEERFRRVRAVGNQLTRRCAANIATFAF